MSTTDLELETSSVVASSVTSSLTLSSHRSLMESSTQPYEPTEGPDDGLTTEIIIAIGAGCGGGVLLVIIIITVVCCVCRRNPRVIRMRTNTNAHLDWLRKTFTRRAQGDTLDNRHAADRMSGQGGAPDVTPFVGDDPVHAADLEQGANVTSLNGISAHDVPLPTRAEPRDKQDNHVGVIMDLGTPSASTTPVTSHREQSRTNPTDIPPPAAHFGVKGYISMKNSPKSSSPIEPPSVTQPPNKHPKEVSKFKERVIPAPPKGHPKPAPGYINAGRNKDKHNPELNLGGNKDKHNPELNLKGQPSNGLPPNSQLSNVQPSNGQPSNGQLSIGDEDPDDYENNEMWVQSGVSSQSMPDLKTPPPLSLPKEPIPSINEGEHSKNKKKGPTPAVKPKTHRGSTPNLATQAAAATKHHEAPAYGNVQLEKSGRLNLKAQVPVNVDEPDVVNKGPDYRNIGGDKRYQNTPGHAPCAPSSKPPYVNLQALKDYNQTSSDQH